MAWKWIDKLRGKGDGPVQPAIVSAGVDSFEMDFRNGSALIEQVNDAIRAKNMERVIAAIGLLEAADAGLQGKLEGLLRMQVPRVDEKLGQIRDAIARAKELIAGFEAVQTDPHATKEVIERSDRAIAHQQAVVDRLKGLAILIGFKISLLLRIYEAVQMLKAAKSQKILEVREKMKPQVELLRLLGEQAVLDREVQAIADFATREMDMAVGGVLPEVLGLMEIAVDTHRDALEAARSLVSFRESNVVDEKEDFDVEGMAAGVKTALERVPVTPIELLGRGTNVEEGVLIEAIDGLRGRMKPFLTVGEGGSRVLALPTPGMSDAELMPVVKKEGFWHYFYQVLKRDDPLYHAKRLALLRQKHNSIGDSDSIQSLASLMLEPFDKAFLEELLNLRKGEAVQAIFQAALCKSPEAARLALSCPVAVGHKFLFWKYPEQDKLAFWANLRQWHGGLYLEMRAMLVRNGNMEDPEQFALNDTEYLLFMAHYFEMGRACLPAEKYESSCKKFFQDRGSGKHASTRGMKQGWVYEQMEEYADAFELDDPQYFSEVMTSDPEIAGFHLMDRVLTAFIQDPSISFATVIEVLNAYLGTRNPDVMVNSSPSIRSIKKYLGLALMHKQVDRVMLEFLKQCDVADDPVMKELGVKISARLNM